MEKVTEIYKINNVQVVDQAEVSTTPSNVNHTKDVIMFAAIGIVVSIIYVIGANMLDTTVKTAEHPHSSVPSAGSSLPVIPAGAQAEL